MNLKTPRIATLTTLKGPLKETLLFVRYHLSAGIEKMFLFFDDPADPAIASLRDNPRVDCVPCDRHHWGSTDPRPLAIEERQHYNAWRGLRLAREQGFDWVIHIDSDELVYSKCGLERLFGTLDPSVQVLHFPTLEAIPEKLAFENVFAEARFFRVAAPQVHGRKHERIKLRLRLESYQRLRPVVALLNDRDFFGESFLLGHVLGKSATRANAPVASIWNHYPNPVEGETLRTKVAKEAWLLHYDACGFDAWATKWKRRYTDEARCIGLPPRRQRQGDRFISLYRNNDVEGLKQLYKELYFLSGKELAILRAFGYVRKLTVPAANFS